MDEPRATPRLPDEAELGIIAAYFQMSPDPSRVTVYRALMKKLLDDIEALEQVDLSGLEPAATFDPRWE